MSLEPGAAQAPHELADFVAAAAVSVPGVAGLHSGTFGEAATYLPGRRVIGVRLGEEVAEIHLTLVYGAPVLETAERVRAAVGPLVSTPVEISVEDIVPATKDSVPPAQGQS